MSTTGEPSSAGSGTSMPVEGSTDELVDPVPESPSARPPRPAKGDATARQFFAGAGGAVPRSARAEVPPPSMPVTEPPPAPAGDPSTRRHTRLAAPAARGLLPIDPTLAAPFGRSSRSPRPTGSYQGAPGARPGALPAGSYTAAADRPIAAGRPIGAARPLARAAGRPTGGPGYAFAVNPALTARPGARSACPPRPAERHTGARHRSLPLVRIRRAAGRGGTR
jgi:hypothetical protein